MYSKHEQVRSVRRFVTMTCSKYFETESLAYRNQLLGNNTIIAQV